MGAAPARSGQALLRITEIFRSLQGEGRHTGLPTCFVRLTGCPLRCSYCDTEYAFHGGERMAMDDVLQHVADTGVRHVCVTGGEPLAQKECKKLLAALCDAGYQVSIETSGAIDFRDLDPRVLRVVDIKTPASGESERQLWEALGELRAEEQVKFVIASRADYDWALQVLRERLDDCAAEVLFSPAVPALNPAQLADWVVADAPPVRFQVQLHKVLWGDVAGR
ncbi:7-carboxy-7-deazaguanine synthase QueE [Algiphilus aromaticivorans]|uniref:7-carboxy-7-deazaguanine synthase QueE n=1 Tax=Algiphilus aromaticivorans TaxID=382454 RepID=UPI0005C2629F